MNIKKLFDLSNRTVILTGGSGLLGSQYAEGLSQAGANLVLADINVGILYLFAVSSLGVYGIIMGGWASNSKYPFLGAIRSAAQMISYEVSIGIIIINESKRLFFNTLLFFAAKTRCQFPWWKRFVAATAMKKVKPAV